MYISAWETFTEGLRSALAEATGAGKIGPNGIVWSGPSGDAVVAADPASLPEEYAEYVDSGTVSEYLEVLD